MIRPSNGRAMELAVAILHEISIDMDPLGLRQYLRGLQLLPASESQKDLRSRIYAICYDSLLRQGLIDEDLDGYDYQTQKHNSEPR